MEKTIKLQDQELQQIKDLQAKSNQLIFGIGQLEIQKRNLVSQLEALQVEQNKLGKELQENYGEGSINLESGEITLKETEE